MPVLSEEARERARELMARYPDPRSATLPLLYLVQAELGYVTREGMREVGELLGLTTAQVEAVATFYTMFRKSPCGRWVISVCTNLSCGLAGGVELFRRARDLLGEGALGVTEDGLFTLEEVECLGACDAAPVVQVNYCNYDRVTPDRLEGILDALRSGEVPDPERGRKPVDHRTTSRILAGLGEGGPDGG